MREMLCGLLVAIAMLVMVQAEPSITDLGPAPLYEAAGLPPGVLALLQKLNLPATTRGELLGETAEGVPNNPNAGAMMQAINTLNRQITTQGGSDRAVVNRDHAYCVESRGALEATIAHKLNEAHEAKMAQAQKRQAKRAAMADREASVLKERDVERVIADMRAEMKTREQNYQSRLVTRRSDVIVLHQATTLVCSFAAFVKDARCKLHAITEAVQAPPKSPTVIATNHTQVRAFDRKERTLAKAYDTTVLATMTTWAGTVVADTALAKKGKVAEGDQPHQVTPAEVSLLQEGGAITSAISTLSIVVANSASEFVASPTRALLISLQVGNFAQASTQLDHALALEAQIEKTQRTDERNTASVQKKLRAQIVSTEGLRLREEAVQERLWTAVDTHSTDIAAQTAAYFLKLREKNGAMEELKGLEAECQRKSIGHVNRHHLRKQERDNIARLRSLLRVIGNSGSIPSCATGGRKRCTSARHGQCVFKNRGGAKCVCEPRFYGKSCSEHKCPGSGSIFKNVYKSVEKFACGGPERGSCNPKTGRCNCNKGFSGRACQRVKTCAGGNCSSRGKCNKRTGQCMCAEGYFGTACEKRMCPGAGPMSYTDQQEEVCSGEGMCDVETGTCHCFDSAIGVKCNRRQCPDHCSGRGSCNKFQGTCQCNAGYQGRSCEYKQCAGGCGGIGSGECDRDSGKCVCRAGYSGANCGKSTTCNPVEAVWSDWAMFKQGWSKCPIDHFLTGVKTGPAVKLANGHVQECTSIDCLQKAKCAKPCFRGSPIQYGHCYQANWWKSFNTKGWSKCRAPYFVTGFYRNKCSSLYCIEVANCCTVHRSTYAQCGDHYWGDKIAKPSTWAEVPVNRFITGLHRNGKDGTLRDMDQASFCNFAQAAYND